MKNWRSIVVGIALVVSLTACGSGASGSATNTSNNTGVSTSTASAAQLQVPKSALGPIPDSVLAAEPPVPDPSIADMPPASDAKSENGLSIQVVGSCGKPGSAGLHLKSSGFTAVSVYMTEVYYGDGTPFSGKRYTNLKLNGFGRVSTDGSTSVWAWDCYLAGGTPFDPPGSYKLTMYDLKTGHTITVIFRVSYPAA